MDEKHVFSSEVLAEPFLASEMKKKKSVRAKSSKQCSKNPQKESSFEDFILYRPLCLLPFEEEEEGEDDQDEDNTKEEDAKEGEDENEVSASCFKPLLPVC